MLGLLKTPSQPLWDYSNYRSDRGKIESFFRLNCDHVLHISTFFRLCDLCRLDQSPVTELQLNKVNDWID